jgi:hypothetical protein
MREGSKEPAKTLPAQGAPGRGSETPRVFRVAYRAARVSKRSKGRFFRAFIARSLVCALLAPAALLAQLQLFLVEGQVERPVVGALDLGSIDAGDALEAVLRVRNPDPLPARLETLSAAGVGFALARAAATPLTLSPGAVFDFAVRFAPASAGAYSAVLAVNYLTVLLRAVALPAPVVWLELEGVRSVLGPSSSVDFGNVERGSSQVRRFILENRSAAELSLAVGVTGAAFRGPAGITSPVALAPGKTLAFEVAFEPAASGIHEGALEINRRTFRLRGVGLEPPFPKPELVFQPAPTGSGQQAWLAIRLASPSRRDGTGQVRMEFRSAVFGAPDDPAIVFLATGKRTASFTVKRGEETAYFAGWPEMPFQTGTTAGSILLTVELGEQTAEATLTLPPLPVVFNSLRGTRATGSVELRLTGFDNSRSTSQVVFTFFDESGGPIAPGRIVVDVAREFRLYFDSSLLGGIFELRAAFPVTGDAASIAEVEVEITNAVGVARTARVRVTR